MFDQHNYAMHGHYMYNVDANPGHERNRDSFHDQRHKITCSWGQNVINVFSILIKMHSMKILCCFIPNSNELIVRVLAANFDAKSYPWIENSIISIDSIWQYWLSYMRVCDMHTLMLNILVYCKEWCPNYPHQQQSSCFDRCWFCVSLSKHYWKKHITIFSRNYRHRSELYKEQLGTY